MSGDSPICPMDKRSLPKRLSAITSSNFVCVGNSVVVVVDMLRSVSASITKHLRLTTVQTVKTTICRFKNVSDILYKNWIMCSFKNT